MTSGKREDGQGHSNKTQISGVKTFQPLLSPAPIEHRTHILMLTSGDDPGAIFSVNGGSAVTIGRSEECDFQFNEPSLSRVHARFMLIGGQVVLTDASSTNGSFVNDTRVDKKALTSGDTIRLGNTLTFHFLTVTEEEKIAFRRLHEMRKMDLLTGLLQKNHFENFLASTLQTRLPGALLLLGVDRLKSVNAASGLVAGDAAIRHISDIVTSAAQGALAGRYGGDVLAVFYRNMSEGEALAMAETLRQRVAREPLDFKGQTLRLSVSVGVSAQQEGQATEASALLDAADEALYRAKRAGGNRVAHSEVGGPRMRRLLDDTALVQQAAAASPPMGILALELPEDLSLEDHKRWQREMIEALEQFLAPADLLGVLRERFVLAATRGEEGHLDQLQRAVLGSLEQRWAEVYPGRPRPSMRRAVLDKTEVRAHGEQSLDVLLSSVQSQKFTASGEGIASRVPFPLAAFHSLVNSRRNQLARIKTLLDGLEMALRFRVATRLGWIRDRGSEAQRSRLAEVLVKTTDLGRNFSAGHWLTLAREMGKIAPDAPFSELPGTNRAQARSRAVAHEQLEKSIQFRNRFAHQTMLSEDAFGEEESLLREVLQALIESHAEASRWRMVSVAEIKGFDDDEATRYALHLHEGPLEHFRIIEESLETKLTGGWCYLLGPQGSPAVSLAPFFAAQPCPTCKRIEVFAADGFVSGPKGAQVALRALTTNHELSIAVPWSRAADALHAELARRRTP